MKKAKFLTKTVGFSWLVLTVLVFLPAETLWSAHTIDFAGQGVASDGTGPFLITIDDIDFFAFNNLDSGSGTATTITGFNSLAGLSSPDLFTFEFGDLELIVRRIFNSLGRLNAFKLSVGWLDSREVQCSRHNE